MQRTDISFFLKLASGFVLEKNKYLALVILCCFRKAFKWRLSSMMTMEVDIKVRLVGDDKENTRLERAGCPTWCFG